MASRRVNRAVKKLLQAEQVAALGADERVKLYRRQEAEIAKLTKDVQLATAKWEQAENELKAAVEQADAAQAIIPPDGLKAWKHIQSVDAGESTPILCLNDWHSEESVDPATINDFNNFNLVVADERIQRTFEKAVTLIEQLRVSTSVKDLVVWLGGDLITNYIHDELIESNFLSPTEACLWVEERVIKGFKYLRDNAGVDHIRVLTNYGNHGRTTKKSRIKTGHKNSFEWMSYNQIARYFEEDKLFSFNVGKGDHIYEEIQGHVIRFHHGDRIKYQGGIGGITIPVMKAISQWDKAKRADLDVFGHWHQFLDHWKFVACGCLIGYSDFSLAIKADYQPPTQTLIVINRRHGKTVAMPIFCEPKALYTQG